MMEKGEWIFKGEVGTSSKTIWGVMMGLVKGTRRCDWNYDIPHDPDDFKRCYKLLTIFPEWRERLHEVGDVFPKWRPYIREWDKMEKLFIEEGYTGKCPKLYELMQSIYPEAMNLDGWVKTGEGSYKRDEDDES